MFSRRTFLQAGAAAAALAAGAGRPAEQRAGRHRHRNQDRPDHALQRAGVGLWHDRPDRGRLFQDDQRAGRRSTAARSTSSASTTATARRRRSSRCAGWSRRSRSRSCSARSARRRNAAIRQYLQREQGAAAVRRHRRGACSTIPSISLDDGLPAELPDGGAHLRQARSGDQAGRQDRACSIRTTISARIT